MKDVEGPQSFETTGRRDAAWVESARGGDAGAFERLVEVYERRAIGVSYRLLNNSADAQEVAQDAFLRAYRSLEKLQDPTRFGPWLMRIVRNLSLNFRRGRRSGQSVELDERQGMDQARTPDGKPIVSEASPDREAVGRELQDRIDAALAQLPDKQRESLVLFTIEGWAQKDIAEHLECSLENVKWNVFQARKKLKEILGEELG